MAEWTVGKLLDHIQELLAEPVGGFYNISTRLDQLNQAQRELAHESRAFTKRAAVTVVVGTRDYALPADFLSLGWEAPYFVDSSLNQSGLEVVDPGLLSARFPHWQDASHTGTPTQLLVRNGTLTVYPTPSSGGTLTLPYVSEPAELVDAGDVPFDGLSHYNRFAPALAYKVAFINAIGRAPQLAGMFQDLFERQERLMRHYARSNPQNKPGVRPPRGEYRRGS